MVLTNWFKKNIVSKYIMTSCPEEKRCLQVLEVILDDGSSKEEEKMYFEHIEKCWACYRNFNLEKEIRELIKSKIDKKKLPEGLVQQIRLEIEKSSA